MAGDEAFRRPRRPLSPYHYSTQSAVQRLGSTSLSKARRYAIENVILDPLLVAAFLLREKWVDREALGLSDDETFQDLVRFDNDRLQLIVNWLVQSVLRSAQDDTPEFVPCHYLGGMEVSVPESYLQMQGHLLQLALKNSFHELRRFTREDQLMKEIVAKVIDDCPRTLPVELVEAFETLQNAGS